MPREKVKAADYKFSDSYSQKKLGAFIYAG